MFFTICESFLRFLATQVSTGESLPLVRVIKNLFLSLPNDRLYTKGNVQTFVYGTTNNHVKIVSLLDIIGKQ